MAMKIIFFIFFLISSICATLNSEEKVDIPEVCGNACPINGNGNLLCAKNMETGELGTFESDCILGRYNSCIRTTQKYEFIKYGEC
ncbi:hypothetical protein PVAND_014080 [Polypedilum vanderplanki]|uniref:Uncharacterized protein n=1 Tax=Polypedilum vanderplanki TaxID=319348 RepID=A0A9J6CT41_POLVA|nr:hypothetical protein PVAND_014080 [Polypedilum vanderplanki]